MPTTGGSGRGSRASHTTFRQIEMKSSLPSQFTRSVMVRLSTRPLVATVTSDVLPTPRSP